MRVRVDTYMNRDMGNLAPIMLEAGVELERPQELDAIDIEDYAMLHGFASGHLPEVER
jgi:hypothetical protein